MVEKCISQTIIFSIAAAAAAAAAASTSSME